MYGSGMTSIGMKGLSADGLFRCGVLEASFCARPRSTNLPVRYAHSRRFQSLPQDLKIARRSLAIFRWWG